MNTGEFRMDVTLLNIEDQNRSERINNNFKLESNDQW